MLGRERSYWTVWSATLIFFAGFYSLLVPLPRYLELLGLTDWQIGSILGVFGLASLLGRTPAGLGVDRWGSRSLLLVGARGLACGAIGTSLTSAASLLGLPRLGRGEPRGGAELGPIEAPAC